MMQTNIVAMWRHTLSINLTRTCRFSYRNFSITENFSYHQKKFWSETFNKLLMVYDVIMLDLSGLIFNELMEIIILLTIYWMSNEKKFVADPENENFHQAGGFHDMRIVKIVRNVVKIS